VGHCLSAPEGFSTKRLLRAEERGRNRSKASHKPLLNAESSEKDYLPQEGMVEERGVVERRERERGVEGGGVRERGLEERAVAFPIARRAPQQAILVAAITEQTAGQHAKAIQARERMARKQRREPLRTLAPEEVEQAPVSGEAHWLLQSMVLGAAPPAIAQSEPALVTLEYKFPLEYQCMLVASF
jgi:hypothetical protein